VLSCVVVLVLVVAPLPAPPAPPAPAPPAVVVVLLVVLVLRTAGNTFTIYIVTLVVGYADIMSRSSSITISNISSNSAGVRT